jgi:hypothetical protein
MQINLSALPGLGRFYLKVPGPLGCCRNGGVANFPLLSEEGRLRDQEKAAKHP